MASLQQRTLLLRSETPVVIQRHHQLMHPILDFSAWVIVLRCVFSFLRRQWLRGPEEWIFVVDERFELADLFMANNCMIHIGFDLLDGYRDVDGWIHNRSDVIRSFWTCIWTTKPVSQQLPSPSADVTTTVVVRSFWKETSSPFRTTCIASISFISCIPFLAIIIIIIIIIIIAIRRGGRAVHCHSMGIVLAMIKQRWLLIHSHQNSVCVVYASAVVSCKSFPIATTATIAVGSIRGRCIVVCFSFSSCFSLLLLLLCV